MASRPGILNPAPRGEDQDASLRPQRLADFVGQAKARAFRASQSGRELKALVVDDGWSAVTGNYLKVRLDEQRTRNTWTRVTL